ncbi:MAG: PAS domain S-box protein [Anaerolineae bacterium]|nr:PAS domain S-box protein [Anaerolineae bacterium]
MNGTKNASPVFVWKKRPSIAGLLLCCLLLLSACNAMPASPSEPGYSLDGFIYDLNQPPDLTRHYWALIILGTLLLLAGLGSGILYIFNRRLHKIMAQRTADLQRSETYYRSIFDNALNAIFIADDEGNYVDVNPAACRMVGYSREEILSKRVSDMLPSHISPETFQAIWRTFLDGGLQTGEYLLQNKGGQFIETEFQAAVNFLPGHHLSILQDVTERKQVEKALRESEARFRAVWEVASDAMVLSDADGVVLDANPAYAKLYGYPLDEIIGQSFTAIYPEERRAAAIKYYRSVFAEPHPQPAYHTNFSRPGGKTLYVESRIGFITNSDGERTALLSIIRDITEHKEAEAALRLSEERFKRVAANAGMVVAQVDTKLRYVWIYNPAPEFDPTKVIGKRDDELGAFAGIQAIMDLKREVLAAKRGMRREITFENPTGPSTFDTFAEPLYNAAEELIGLTTIGIDLTEQKQMQAALKESQEKYRHSEQFLRKIYDEAQVSLFVIDVTPDGDFRYVGLNPAHQRLTGLRNEDIAGKYPEAVPGIDAEAAAQLRSNYARCVVENRPIQYEELFVIRERETWYLTQLSPLWDDNGRVYQLIGSCLNITEQKQAEDQIRQLSQAVEQSPEAIIITNAQEEIEYVNPAFTTITGYSFAEAKGQNPSFLGSGQTPAEVYDDLHPTVLAGQTYRCEFLNKKKSGELYWVQAVISPIKDDQGRVAHLLSIQEDISERKRFEQEQAKLEAHLRQSQRLETIGTLAGGIAHDFNNILTPIIGYTELALTALPENHPIRSDLERVVNAADRAKELVQQILSFSRQFEQEKIVIDLQPLIKEVLTLLRPSLPATIEIRQEIAPNCGPILADPAQFHQVLMNLCTNAYQAMEQTGGVLTISLAQVAWNDLDQALTATLTKNAYACLKVTDTGYGMDTATLDRAFEPFFTTKPPGQGTGLGLSVVHGIVKSYQGAILAHSEMGKGTTFELYFPIAATSTPVDTIAIEPSGQTAIERILVVDDEPVIVELLSQWLTKQGYEVVEQTSSTNALSLYRKDAARFDLVITDLTMPQMTGLQLARQMTALRSNLPIILITGNDSKLSQTDLDQSGVKWTITKPIVFKKLTSVIRQLLN